MSSLYSMLPTSKNYLTRAGLSPAAAAYTLISLFLAGVVVIRIVSAFIHRHIPSSIVDCAHTHNIDPEAGDLHAEEDRNVKTSPIPNIDINGSTEHTPLLQRQRPKTVHSTPAMVERGNEDELADGELGKESLRHRWQRQLAHVLGGTKRYCGDDGPCYGVSQTCGSECTKVMRRASEDASHLSVSPQGDFQASVGRLEAEIESETPQTPLTVRHVTDGCLTAPPDTHTGTRDGDYFMTRSLPGDERQVSSHSNSKPGPEESVPTTLIQVHHEHHHEHHHHAGQHHHHVPQNAFMSIGLQTSLAIALHKLPEGFITYATNHASPTLGLTIFIALFIHNITEGFAMALPLYLALNSRWKAILWSFLLGGVSQPAGAGIAALWIWGYGKARGGDGSTSGTSWGVYGGMFAATAGVMTSVGLQLYSEGLGLTHNRNICIGFAILGMGVLGVSFALTA